MKAGWQINRFDEVLEIRNGKNQRSVESATGQYPIFGSAGKVMGYATDFICEAGATIIGRKGTINTPIFSDTNFWNVDTAFGLSPKASLDAKFLHYYCLSYDFSLHNRGTTIPSLIKTDLLQISIPVPPLPEQQRIVALLDKAFDGIATAKANAEKNRQNARALFASHLQSVFTQRGEGWVEKPLGELCDFLNGFAFKSSDTVADSGTQLVRMGNLYGSKLDLERNAVFYPDSFALDFRRFILNEGDIIMSLTGTTGKEDYGFAVRVPESDRRLVMNQRIAKFDSIREDRVSRDYLLHYLRSRAFLDLLYPTANGTRQANLSTVTMKTLPVPLCSISKQKAVTSSLDSLATETQRLESLYQQKLAALDALKKSLLHQAFSGVL